MVKLKKLTTIATPINYQLTLKKTNFMIIGSKQKKIGKIEIGNIEQTQYIKYLGMYIDEDITWEQRITHVEAKIAKNSGITTKLRYHIDLIMLN